MIVILQTLLLCWSVAICLFLHSHVQIYVGVFLGRSSCGSSPYLFAETRRCLFWDSFTAVLKIFGKWKEATTDVVFCGTKICRWCSKMLVFLYFGKENLACVCVCRGGLPSAKTILLMRKRVYGAQMWFNLSIMSWTLYLQTATCSEFTCVFWNGT